MRKLRASSAAQWTRCPGAVEAQSHFPNTSSDFALEGTCAHEVAMLSWQEDEPPQNYVGQELVFTDGKWTVDVEMANYVQQYLDEVERFSPSGEAFWVDAEVNVPIGHVTGELNPDGEYTTGQVDRLWVFMRDDGSFLVHVHDLKYGKGVAVEAKENLQGLLYALGAIEELNWLLDGAVVEVRLFIHQPRLHSLSDWTVDAETLEDRKLFLKARAEETKQAEPPRIPGVVQCRFCSAAGTEKCPESTKLARDTEFLDPDDVKVLDQNWETIQFVEQWAKKARARLQEAAEQGAHFRNVKLVAGKSSRNWKVDEEEVAKMLQNRGLKAAQVWERKVLSPAKAEKALGKDKYNKLADELVEKKEGKPSLASMSDKRPAVNSAEALGFDTIQE